VLTRKCGLDQTYFLPDSETCDREDEQIRRAATRAESSAGITHCGRTG
jgi:hypothetical protein